jgi:hypothetical protein
MLSIKIVLEKSELWGTKAINSMTLELLGGLK